MNMAAPDFQLTPIEGSPAESDWKNDEPSYAGAVEVTNVGAPVPNAGVAADADMVSAMVSDAASSVAAVTARARDRRMRTPGFERAGRPTEVTERDITGQGR